MTKITNKTRNIIYILIVLAFIIAITGSTYSRYRGTATTNANAGIAKWQVRLNTEDISLESKTINVQAVDSGTNENVSAGKLAPGKTMKVELQVDPTGSEVAIDYTFKIDTQNLKVVSSETEVPSIQDNLTIYKVECKTESEDGEKVKTVLLDDEGTAKYFESLDDVLNNRKITFVAYITWDDGDSVVDTQSGMNITSIEAPIIVTAKQHIGNNETEAEHLELNLGALGNGETLTLSQDIDFTSKYTAGAGNVLSFPDNATLDLGRNTISSQNMGVIYAGNNLKIQNGNFTTPGSYGAFIGANNTSNNITVRNIQSDGGLNIYNAKNVVIEDSVITAHNYYAVWGDANSEITINSGTYQVTEKSTALFGRSKAGNEREGFKINGGTFKTNGKKFCLEGDYLPPVIYGGTFDCDVSAYVAEGRQARQVDDTTWVVE